MDLNKKLTLEEQTEILYELFGFVVGDGDTASNCKGVIYDEEGDEFYGSDSNDKFDLTCFSGIIKYSKHLAFEDGKAELRHSFRKLLGA